VVIVEDVHLNRLKNMSNLSGGNGSSLPKILILNAATAEIKEYEETGMTIIIMMIIVMILMRRFIDYF